MCLKSFIACLLAFSLSLAPANTCFANPGLVVGGATIDREVGPGIYSHVIAVSLGQGDPATDVQVNVKGFGQKSDGVLEPVSPALDTGPYTARGFINVDSASFHLDPGESKDVNVTINVPGGVGDGGRYAVISVCLSPPAGGDVNVASGIVVPVVLTIQGSEFVHSGEISGLSANVANEGQYVEIMTGFRNTGNHHFKIKGEGTVYSAGGQALATISEPLAASSLIPAMSMLLKATYAPAGGLSPGNYSVLSRVMLEDGTLLDEATGQFTVTVKTPGPAGGGYSGLPGRNPNVNTPLSPAFNDIAGHWAESDLKVMSGLRIVRGVGGGKFCPDRPVTRAEFAAFLIRSLGIEEVQPKGGHFKDVRDGDWYYGAVEAAFKAGLLRGYPDGSLRPNARITREEIAAILARVLTQNQKQATTDIETVLARFTDRIRIAIWARKAAALTAQERIIEGRSGGLFAPKENATRAEAVVLLKRMLVSLGRLSC
ncbi:MAG: S-layer homology domain-containing protein [Bacillota bacterium]